MGQKGGDSRCKFAALTRGGGGGGGGGVGGGGVGEWRKTNKGDQYHNLMITENGDWHTVLLSENDE